MRRKQEYPNRQRACLCEAKKVAKALNDGTFDADIVEQFLIDEYY